MKLPKIHLGEFHNNLTMNINFNMPLVYDAERIGEVFEIKMKSLYDGSEKLSRNHTNH